MSAAFMLRAVCAIRVTMAVISLVPDLLVNPCARENLAGVSHEKGKQRLLLARQIQGFAGAPRSPSRQVQLDVRVTQHGALARFSPPDQRPHAGQ